MSKIPEYCKYHPNQIAGWMCASCHTYFCSSCVPEDNKNYSPKCSLCRRSLTSLSIASRIPALHLAIADLLLRPFNQSILLLLGCFAFIIACLPQSLLGVILLILVSVPLIEFLFEYMEKTASGELLKIKVASYLKLENKGMFIRFALIAGLISYSLLQIFQISEFLGSILTIFFVLGLPASIIILMMEKSMFSMVNPLKIIFIIKQFKSAYVLLYVFILTVLWGIILASQLTEFTLFIRFFVNGVVLYSLACVFVIAGYLVYRFHSELNFTINRQSLHTLNSNKSTDAFAEVDIFIHEGRFEDAQALLIKHINDDKCSYKAYEKLILLYAIQNKENYLKQTIEEYLDVLHRHGKNKQAADFISQLKKREITYFSDKTEIVLALVEHMKNKHQFQTALAMISYIIERQKMPEHWEELYIAYASLLAEFANKIPEAADALKLVINRSLNQEKMEQAEAYLKVLQY